MSASHAMSRPDPKPSTTAVDHGSPSSGMHSPPPLASLELLQLLDASLPARHPPPPSADPDWLQALHSRTFHTSPPSADTSSAASTIASLIADMQSSIYPLDKRSTLLTDLISAHLADLTHPASLDALVGWLQAQSADSAGATATVKVARRDQAAVIALVGDVLGNVAGREGGTAWRQVLGAADAK